MSCSLSSSSQSILLSSVKCTCHRCHRLPLTQSLGIKHTFQAENASCPSVCRPMSVTLWTYDLQCKLRPLRHSVSACLMTGSCSQILSTINCRNFPSVYLRRLQNCSLVFQLSPHQADGFALTMLHGLGGLSTYGLNGHREGDEQIESTPLCGVWRLLPYIIKGPALSCCRRSLIIIISLNVCVLRRSFYTSLVDFTCGL